MHPFGVELSKIDLRTELDGRSSQQFERLLDTELLLVIRDQELSDEVARRFVSGFGPLVDGIGVVTTEEATGRGELEFHSERSFQRKEPLRGLSLYGKSVPESGGATLFINCVAACAALPDDLRATLATVDTIHQFDPRIRLGAGSGGNVPEGGWRTVHPAIWQHPVTGVPVLFVSRWFTRRVIGMDSEASEQLLTRVFDHLSEQRFLYRHEWRENDFVLWDNFALAHAREPFDESKPRVLRKYEFMLRPGFALPAPRQADVMPA